LDFTTAADPYTESAFASGMDCCGYHCPSLGNSAAFLEFEVSRDWREQAGLTTAQKDALATWETLKKTDDANFQYPVAVGTTRAIRWNPADMMVLERFRLKAVQAGGAAANQTTGTVDLMMGKVRA
jgi:hypothetical protein